MMQQQVWRAPRREKVFAYTLYLLVTFIVSDAVIASGGTTPYAVTIAHTSGATVSRGAEVTLDIEVTNLRAQKNDEWIAAVVLDFSSTRIMPLDSGSLPPDWQGVLETEGVITFTAGHGVSALSRGASVRLAPRVRLPADTADVAPPRVFVVPLASVRSFQGPALKALAHVKHREVKPAASLQLAE